MKQRKVPIEPDIKSFLQQRGRSRGALCVAPRPQARAFDPSLSSCAAKPKARPVTVLDVLADTRAGQNGTGGYQWWILWWRGR